MNTSDSGPGIPDELSARLYRPLSASNAPYGAGLDPAICLEIVQVLGSSIALKNRHANGRVMGLGATVRLPLVQNIA